jgi:hypothetical protein
MSILFAAPIDQHPDYNKVTTTPTCSTADANFPAANLLTYDPTMVFTSTIQNPVILWDLGSARAFDVISLVYTNLTDVATLLIEGSPDNITYTTLQVGTTLALAHTVVGQTTQNKSNMLRHNLTLYLPSSPQTYRYIRITPNTQIGGVFPQIGRLFVGTKFVPSTGWQYGSSFSFGDMSKRERTDQGALVLNPLPAIISANVKMDFLTKNEMMDFIYEFNYWRGSAREMLACLDVEDTKRLQKNTLYCTISDGRTISFDSYNAHSVSWVLESIGIG